MKTLLLVCLLLGLVSLRPATAQERDGNFTIRFEPTVKLQSGVEVPFSIVVTDPRHKPVEHAQVLLQIKDKDNMNVRDFKGTMVSPGAYIAKPSFSAPGTWNVYVEVRRDQEVTSRSIPFQVPE